MVRKVAVERGIRVPADDGVTLLTDHYSPVGPSGAGPAPAVLIRTPYGRGGLYRWAARAFASRGLHVVVSACRGTGGSGGGFDPLCNEREDGLATVAWLRRQPWFDGRLGTFGPSYVGFTQWAIADVPELAAMAVTASASSFRDPINAGGSFALFTMLTWASSLQAERRSWLLNKLDVLRGHPRLRRALDHLPLGEADVAATGAELAYFRRWVGLANSGSLETAAADDGYWDGIGHDHRLAAVTAPVLMVGGWHDIFLPWQMRDYAALRAAGARPYLTIGPWLHASSGMHMTALREAAVWFANHLLGQPAGLRERPVRLRIEGGDWQEYDEWPPAAEVRVWHLHPRGQLSLEPAQPSEPDRFTYDPVDPTPAVGGPVLLVTAAGPKDNRRLEARPDVLVYTSEALTADLEVVGPVGATMYVRPSAPYYDVFVRLCDVHPSGGSFNVCDGLVRATGRFAAGIDGVFQVKVELWPVGHRFPVGHRLRVQVSAGAHPMYPRNTGNGHPMATAVELIPVDIEVFHDPAHPSAITLPVTTRLSGETCSRA